MKIDLNMAAAEGNSVKSIVVANVYQVESKAGGHVYAIKQIELLKEERNDVLINREVSILQTLNHVNVVRYDAAWREHGTPDVELDKVYIMMDYCDYNLQQVYDIITSVYKRKTHETICPVSYFIKLTLVEGILVGLGYLHDMGIMHRDIKQNNILVKQDGDCWTVKLCDFGLAKVEKSGSQHTQSVGTVSYKAPEVKHGGEYNHLADVFSLGIMLMQFDVNVNK
ncbi:unnamed protein product [Medioppia subpectinata]|uniref:Protein kinase domain-containing protein n=1 Tax=Medioppia subpectinata TaxID=1979941 RepID=A0A7R9KN03_9ACAR|nr:unnamed protein product [Medioppia subpectinata]CAG2106527.1 unnamed protein product [Medioppia subpectinata]